MQTLRTVLVFLVLGGVVSPVVAQLANNSQTSAPLPPGPNSPALDPSHEDEDKPAQAPEERMIPNAVEDPQADSDDLGLSPPGTKVKLPGRTLKK